MFLPRAGASVQQQPRADIQTPAGHEEQLPTDTAPHGPHSLFVAWGCTDPSSPSHPGCLQEQSSLPSGLGCLAYD